MCFNVVIPLYLVSTRASHLLIMELSVEIVTILGLRRYLNLPALSVIVIFHIHHRQEKV